MVVVQKQRNFGSDGNASTSIANKVKRGDVRHAVIVRARKEIQRPDGSVVKFDDNACVLINKSGDPIGTRLNGWSRTFMSYGGRHITNMRDVLNRNRWSGVTT